MTALLRVVCVWAGLLSLGNLWAVNDSLPPLVHADRPSVLVGRVTAPQLKGDTVSLLYATVAGLRTMEQAIDSTGHFRFEVNIGHSSEVRIGFSSRPHARISVFLVPGQETGVDVEERIPRLQYRYTGPLARVNDEFANTVVFTPLFPEVLKIGKGSSVKDVLMFRNYLIGKHAALAQAIGKQETLSLATRQLLLMQRQIELYALLKDASFYLAMAGVLPDDEPLSMELPATYFLPVTAEIPLGSSWYLYCLEYPYLMDQIRALRPLPSEEQLQEEMYREAQISDRDYNLLQRLNDLSGAPIRTFTEEERQRLYACLQLKEAFAAAREARYWESIFKTDLGAVREYWEALDLAEKTRAFIPLTEAEKQRVGQWQSPSLRGEILANDSVMYVKKIRGLQEKPVQHDADGQVTPEDLFYSLHAPHQGEAVLLVFWEVWDESSCAALTALQPMKETLARQGIQVVSVASAYSPEAEWKEHAAQYSGLHVRVSTSQMRVLRNEYALHPLPVYYLVSAGGEVLERITGVPVRQMEEILTSVSAQ